MELFSHNRVRWLPLSILLINCLGFCKSSFGAESQKPDAVHEHSKVVNHFEHQSKQAVQSINSAQHPEKTDHKLMDHSKMDHSKMQHSAASEITHNVHTHSSVLGEQVTTTPGALRDPHAYAEGYTVGHFARHKMGDEEPIASLLMDRLESVNSTSNNDLTYDFQAWYGLTYNRLLVRAEGSINKGAFENARSEVLWAHALTPYWDSQVGIRYDSGRGTDRGWLAFGVQGLAPYWVYVEATGYVNEQGRTAFRLELEYDLLITQKLILQPRTELNFYSRSDVSRNVQSGLSDAELGIRLRYELVREFAPYIGVDWEYRPGQSVSEQQLSIQASVSEVRFVAGVRFWY